MRTASGLVLQGVLVVLGIVHGLSTAQGARAKVAIVPDRRRVLD